MAAEIRRIVTEVVSSGNAELRLNIDSDIRRAVAEEIRLNIEELAAKIQRPDQPPPYSASVLIPKAPNHSESNQIPKQQTIPNSPPKLILLAMDDTVLIPDTCGGRICCCILGIIMLIPIGGLVFLFGCVFYVIIASHFY